MQNYWDNVAEQASSGGLLKDNWFKRRGLIKHLLDYNLTKTNILEIGCGLGLTAGMLKMIYGGYFKYTGTDISEKFCNLAKEKLHLDTVQTYANDMPFPDKEFDCLFAFDVLEHIPAGDKADVYKELNRVLKDTAFVFINNPDPENPCSHSPDVEHGFTDIDMGQMCQTMNMRVYELTRYEGFEGYFYNFIVLKR